MRGRAARRFGSIAITLLLVAVSRFSSAQEPTPPDDGYRSLLVAELSCPQPVIDGLEASREQGRNATEPRAAPDHHSVGCEMARDALCAARPGNALCAARKPRGAYGGYYLARHAMPVVTWLRQELPRDAAQRDEELLGLGLRAMVTVLDLLEPGLAGCANAPFLRTWCTGEGKQARAVPSHRTLVAFFASEVLALLVECQGLGERCPLREDPAMNRRIALWFDLLAWDHALLDLPNMYNSLTVRVPGQARGWRRLELLQRSFAETPGRAPPFQFAVEGWSVALAANLLVVDHLLANQHDPRLAPLTEVQDAVLRVYVEKALAVLGQRLSTTRVWDFNGDAAEGAVFDVARWDAHPYRRFSAVSDGPRPFTVEVPAGGGEPTVRFAGAEAAPARNTGHDSGHYRRLVWLMRALDGAARALDVSWSDPDMLQGLANQFAYAVYRHPCRSGQCAGGQAISGPPRFSNYVTGIDGWYRLVPDQPCEPGVPPSGFSTMMLLSENLWWSRFNRDILSIWSRIDTAVGDGAMPAPSRGDVTPCGEDAGKQVWHQSYHDVFEGNGRSARYYAVAFAAMQRWAWFALRP